MDINDRQKNMSVSEEFVAKVNKDNKTERIKQYMPAFVFSFLITVACFIVPGFFTKSNLHTLFSQVSIPLVCATGMTYILLMGCMDLSIDGVVSLSGVAISYLVANSKTNIDLNFFAVIIVVVSAAIVGLIIGILHTKLRLPSFIITYAVGIILTGFAIMICRGIPAQINSSAILSLKEKFLGVPIITWLAIVVVIISYIILNYTSFGRCVYAIGDNEDAIRTSGVDVDKVKIKAFVISAVCAAIAGLFAVSRLGFGDISIGKNRVFPAITACVVGGTSITGGKGGMVQCIIGVFFITVLNNIMVLLGIDSDYQDAILGLIVIISVIISTVRKRNIVVK